AGWQSFGSWQGRKGGKQGDRIGPVEWAGDRSALGSGRRRRSCGEGEAMRIGLLLFLPICLACTARAQTPAVQQGDSATETRKKIDRAIDRGVSFIVKAQQPDGSWGTGKVTRGLEVYSSVPGSHDAFRVATTALCVMALREAGETEAHQ